MKRKYIWFNIALTALSMLIFLAAGIAVTRDNHYTEAKQRIITVTDICKNNYTTPQRAGDKVSQDVRITVIDQAGNVIADSKESNVTGMGNHIDREEILSALNGSPATVVRKSETLGVDMVYYAEKVDTEDGYVFLRTAVPVQGVRTYVIRTIPIMVTVMAVTLLVSGLFSTLFGMHILDPIRRISDSLRKVRDGTYTPVIADTSDDEINTVINDINDISRALQTTLAQAQDGRKKLDDILKHISNGIVAIDRCSGNIAMCNRAAVAVFGVEHPEGHRYTVLSSDREWNETVGAYLKSGIAHDGSLCVSDKIFSYTMRTLDNGLTLIVLSDVTAERNSARMRSEFFANASHELKTPLTAIKGFNEIIGMKTEDPSIKEMSGKIGHEADRMISLLGDMLDLTRLESEPKLQTEPVVLADCAEEVIQTLSALAGQKQVSVSVHGDGCVMAEREHIIEVIKNLVENGIRYNHAGGSVTVTVSSDGTETTLSVADNGIGIEPEHQSRVFERFYRVSKSRSRETGGTGLGLAIVKHICELYGAQLSLQSVFGVGTTVTIRFPSASAA